MRLIQELSDLDPTGFYPLEDLIIEGFTTVKAAASAVELVGIQAFDSCGRFVILSPENTSTFRQVSIDGALKKLEAIMGDEYARIYNNDPYEDPQDTHDYWRLQAELPQVHIYGWRIGDLPDFEKLHQQWCQQVLGKNLRDIPTTKLTKPAENSVRKLLRSLVILCYGEEAAQTLDEATTPLITQIQGDLELKGITIDSKTLRKWLKHQPS